MSHKMRDRLCMMLVSTELMGRLIKKFFRRLEDLIDEDLTEKNCNTSSTLI